MRGPLITLLCVAALLQVGWAEKVVVHVSPTGSDPGNGSVEHPFSTLELARDFVRSQIGKPVTVILDAGNYYRPNALELSAADSGTAEATREWRAAKNGKVRLIGGTKIAPNAWHPVTDPGVLARLDPAAREHVLELDVEALKLPVLEKFPDFFIGGAGLFQLFLDGSRMPLSRWPNGSYTTVKEVTDSGLAPKPHGGTFIYRDDRVERWQAALTANELYIAGFWRVPWIIQSVRVEKIDPATKAITLAATVPLGIGSKYVKEIAGTRKGNGKENYYALNLVEEIDQPGEWAYRFATKKLYFWPTKDLAKTELLMVTGNEPVVRETDASYVHISDLQIEGSLSAAVEVRGGEHNVLNGCTITNTGGDGVVISRGTGHGLQSCDFSHIGGFGIRMTGGDRKTLTRGDLFADNNHIHHVGEVTKIVEAIKVEGVGNRVTHNLIHDVPSNGVQYAGNDHLFEFNELHNVGLDSGDLGGFYTNDTWTSRGNILRSNFVHHSPAANGIYIDDGDGGDLISGNLFYRNACGVFISGGPDNLIVGNEVIDCKKGLHIDDRGVSRGYNTNNQRYIKPLVDFNYKNPPWSVRYPALTHVLDGNPELPNGTVFRGNVLIRCEKPINLSGKPENLKVVQFQDNLELADAPKFVDEAALDFTISTSVGDTKFPSEFQPIQHDKIGLYTDASRLKIPTLAETGGNEERQRPEAVFNSETDMKRSNEIGASVKPPNQ